MPYLVLIHNQDNAKNLAIVNARAETSWPALDN